MNHQTRIPRIVSKNIADLLDCHRQRLEKEGRWSRIAERVTDAFGTSTFLLLHVLWFVLWVADNSGFIPGLMSFDPYPFGFLTFVVSLEAIFLSIMVLMVQNRIQKDADRRAELDLHINLLAEQESTVILRKLIRIEERLGIQVSPAEKKNSRDLIHETDIAGLEKEIEKNF